MDITSLQSCCHKKWTDSDVFLQSHWSVQILSTYSTLKGRCSKACPPWVQVLEKLLNKNKKWSLTPLGSCRTEVHLRVDVLSDPSQGERHVAHVPVKVTSELKHNPSSLKPPANRGCYVMLESNSAEADTLQSGGRSTGSAFCGDERRVKCRGESWANAFSPLRQQILLSAWQTHCNQLERRHFQ